MMRTRDVLLLVSMLSSALSLKCYPCSANPYTRNITCTDCAVQCAGSTTTVDVYVLGGITPLTLRTMFYELSCGSPGQCTNTSINLGMVKITNNTQCCSTNYCNNNYPEVLPEQPANGKTCYVCNENGCSEKLSCAGAEDHCITGLVTQGTDSVTMKGCTTKDVCNMTQIRTQGLLVTNLKCCKGNLCNGAESVTLSFLLMFISLLSFVLFH